jgi:hypothetical protein
MKTERLSIRLSEKRMNKLRAIAVEQEKTITQVVSDWLDSMPAPECLSKLANDEQV